MGRPDGSVRSIPVLALPSIAYVAVRTPTPLRASNPRRAGPRYTADFGDLEEFEEGRAMALTAAHDALPDLAA